MRIAHVACVFLSGCNAVFGIRGSVGLEFFDAPIDAAPQCPPLGTTPAFRPAVHSLPFASCDVYTISEAANRAVARCTSDGHPVAQGAIEGTLDAVPTTDAPSFYYYYARLSADGDRIARLAFHRQPFYWTVEVDHYDPAVGYIYDSRLPYMAPESTLSREPWTSNITARPEPHLVVTEQSLTANAYVLHELAEVGGTWSEIDSYNVTALTDDMKEPSLSPDGLRMVYSKNVAGANVLMYTDRPTIQDRFHTGEAIAEVPPGVDWPMMTTDCGKLYFTGLQTTFYLEQ
jgi:hypothetical protein